MIKENNREGRSGGSKYSSDEIIPTFKNYISILENHADLLSKLISDKNNITGLGRTNPRPSKQVRTIRTLSENDQEKFDC